jgi:hypothetical protein
MKKIIQKVKEAADLAANSIQFIEQAKRFFNQ